MAIVRRDPDVDDLSTDFPTRKQATRSGHPGTTL